MKVLILGAGNTVYDLHDGEYPLSMVEFNGKPLLERIIMACKGIRPIDFIFAVKEVDLKKWHLRNIFGLLTPNSKVVSVPDDTAGAACTALLGIEHINDEEYLLILSANQLVDVDFLEVTEIFKQKGYDAGTIIFDSIHPRYSFVKLDEDEMVSEAAEKKPISRNATAGVYWFKQGSDFVRAAMQMIRKDASIDDSFYICPSFNQLILEQKKVGVYRINNEDYHPLKTDRQVQLFEHHLESQAGS